MVKDLVSILIPCYNHSAFIERCLQSIINDKYSKKEIIIIDDGSKDNSVEIIEKFIKDHKLNESECRLIQQENAGVVKTLNRLIDLANGEYITLIASDDELFENGIAKRVEFLRKTNYSAVIGNACVIDENDNVIKEYASSQHFKGKLRNLLNEKKFYKELILQWCIAGPCLLLKSEVYNRIGKYDEDFFVEDRDFYLRLIENNLLGYLPDTVASYRVHGSNSTKINKKRIRIECARINLKHAKNQKKILYRWFLSTYRIDIFLLSRDLSFLFRLHRFLRFAIVYIIRCF